MSTPTGLIPVLERIRLNLKKTIAGIGLSTGYTFNAIAAEPDRLGEQTGDGVVVIELGAAQLNPEIQANQLVEWWQEFLFLCFVVQSESNAASWDGLIAKRAADIHKAVQVDYTRGGWAHDTVPHAPEWFQRGEGEHEGVIARCFVRYRHDFGNPYSAR